MPVDLGDRSAEPLPELSLQRMEDLPLALQVVGFVQVQADLDDTDVRGHGPRIGVAVTRKTGTYRANGELCTYTVHKAPVAPKTELLQRLLDLAGLEKL